MQKSKLWNRRLAAMNSLILHFDICFLISSMENEKEKKQVNVEQRVKKVVARHLKTDEDKIKPDSDFARDLGAESIQSIELVAAFEEEFDIEMDDQAVLAVRAVGDAVEFIKKMIDDGGAKAQ